MSMTIFKLYVLLSAILLMYWCMFTDVNECIEFPSTVCASGGTCVNSPGAYSCIQTAQSK